MLTATYMLGNPADRYRRMVEGDGTGDTGSGAGGSDGGPLADDGLSVLQAEIDRVAGRTRSEATKAAERKIAEQLGCTVDQAKQRLAALAAAENEQKSEAQRALDEANTARADAEKAREDAVKERLAAKVERKLIAAGVPETALARAARMVALDPDADDDAITAEIEALKTDLPALFAPAGGHGAPPPPPAPARPPVQRPTTVSIDPARERARKRLAASVPAAS